MAKDALRDAEVQVVEEVEGVSQTQDHRDLVAVGEEELEPGFYEGRPRVYDPSFLAVKYSVDDRPGDPVYRDAVT